MKVKYLIQYPDRNSSDYEDMGFVDMDEAISAYNDFPWGEQMKIAEEREAKNLSTSLTHIIFKNVEKDESMIIYGTETDNAEIYFQVGKKYSTTLIDGDITKKPERIDVVDYIIAFFQNNLELEFTNEEYEEEEITELGHSTLKMYLLKRFWILLLPILFFIIMIGINYNPIQISVIWFFIAIYGFFFILYLPFVITYIQYLIKSKIKSASFNSDYSNILLDNKNQKTIIKRTEILQIVHTYCSNGNFPGYLLSNISITLKDKRQFFLTTLAFSDDELSFILRKLNVHHYSIGKLFPLIHTRLLNMEARLDPKDYADKSDLEKLYKDYPDDILNEILKNKKEYQPDAVKAARKEIELRKKYN